MKNNSHDHYFYDVNPVIRFLILSDTLIIGATGLFAPVFALFITDFISGGDAAVVGTAVGIFLFTQSIFQIPIAHFVDKVRGENDDFWLMFVCTLLFSIAPLLYLFITTPYELYFVQFVLGITSAFTHPTYMAIFTRHIDKNKEGTEWSIYFTLTGLTAAIFSALGGYIVTSYGFDVLIELVVFLSVIGSLLIYPIRTYLKNK